jgi:hypothetical protein
MYTGNLNIGDVSLPCAVLDTGQRVLTQEGFLQAIGRSKNPKGNPASHPDETPAFLTAQNLQPYISKHITTPTSPILFKPIRDGGSPAYGYPAELLPAFCRVILDARDAKALSHTQQHIAERCDILIRGLATVGIVALVDEATGYQNVRRRNALMKILEAYIAKELLRWTKHFPDEFYEHMFRLWGWGFNEESLSRRPGFAGVLTRKLIYEKLPPGVLDELQRMNPTDGHGRRKFRHHQLLTADIGHPHLQKLVTEVTLLMRISDSRTGFLAQYARAYPTVGTQMYLDLDNEDLA